MAFGTNTLFFHTLQALDVTYEPVGELVTDVISDIV